MIQVGKTTIRDPTKKVGARYAAYSDVIFAYDGWANAEYFLPHEYDLLSIKTDKGEVKKGWISGNAWDGLEIKPKDKIIEWKRTFEE